VDFVMFLTSHAWLYVAWIIIKFGKIDDAEGHLCLARFHVNWVIFGDLNTQYAAYHRFCELIRDV